MPSSLEHSGSLTGHILSQGSPDTAAAPSRNARVIVILAVVLTLVVVAGMVIAILARNNLADFLGNIQ